MSEKIEVRQRMERAEAIQWDGSWESAAKVAALVFKDGREEGALIFIKNLRLKVLEVRYHVPVNDPTDPGQERLALVHIPEDNYFVRGPRDLRSVVPADEFREKWEPVNRPMDPAVVRGLDIPGIGRVFR